MWYTGKTSQKYILPHLPNTISEPPDEHALYKDNFATGNGELSKVIADIAVVDHTVVNQPTLRWKRRQDRLKTAAPLLFANKSSAVKHASWSNSCRLWYSVLRAVCKRIFSFYFSQLIANEDRTETASETFISLLVHKRNRHTFPSFVCLVYFFVCLLLLLLFFVCFSFFFLLLTTAHCLTAGSWSSNEDPLILMKKLKGRIVIMG